MSAVRIIKTNANRAELKAKAKLNRTAHLHTGRYWAQYQKLKDSEDPKKRRMAQRYLELYRIGTKRRGRMKR